MLNFTDTMTKLYNQIAEVKNSFLTPYYLFISEDVYNILRAELPRTAENQGLPADKVTLQFIEGMEVVVFNKPENYMSVKGIRTNEPSK